MSLITFLESIFPFLFKAMQKIWDSYSAAQKAAVINAGQIGQLLKQNLTMLSADLVTLIATQTGLPPELISSTLITLAAKFGLTTTSVDAAVIFLQGKLTNAASNEDWNGLLSTILNAGGIILSGGTLTWAQLAIGIGEWAFQKFVKPQV